MNSHEDLFGLLQGPYGESSMKAWVASADLSSTEACEFLRRYVQIIPGRNDKSHGDTALRAVRGMSYIAHLAPRFATCCLMSVLRRSSRWLVQMRVAEVLEALGSQASEAAATLMGLYRGPLDELTRDAISKALVAIGDAAVRHVLPALSSERIFLYHRAESLLARISGERVFSAMRKLILGNDPVMVARSFAVLARMELSAPQAKGMRRRARAGMRHKHRMVRMRAADFLGSQGLRAESSLTLLESMAEDDSDHCCSMAATMAVEDILAACQM